jgi:glycosyltransferase involved in cell wall biosynthesis
MLWDHPTWAAWRVARAARKPFVVTPHGSLSAEWRSNSLHKRLYRLAVLDNLLNEASALHALNEDEAQACRKWGLKARIEVIPNGLPLAAYEKRTDPAPARDRWPVLAGRRVILFLGRLWWQKGLDILPAAWAEANPHEEWLLVIAGPDYRSYGKILLSKIVELGLESKILLTGPVSGELKQSLLAASECLVLPSYSEGFSMALLEGMAARLPCLFTSECHFPELSEHGGGWEIPVGQSSLCEALRGVCSRSVTENKTFGLAAHALGKARYTSETVAARLLSLYRSIQ